MAQSKEKQPLNKIAANWLWNLLTITVVEFTPAINRHPGHDFYGHAYVRVELNPASALFKGVIGDTLTLLNLALSAFKLGFFSLEVKTFRKTGLFNVSGKEYKGKDGKFRPNAAPLTAELQAVIQLAVERDPRVKAAIAACQAMPIPAAPVTAVVPASPEAPFGGQTATAPVLGEMPFSG